MGACTTTQVMLSCEPSSYARAANMRALALTGDDAQAWGLVYELMTYFDEASWTDTARRKKQG